MNVAFNYGHWDLWQLYQKVTFDGANRIIRVNPDVTELNIKTDVYSDWKDWVNSKDDNAVWLPALRTIGGDPTVAGEFAGDIYFLINGWKLQIDLTKVKVTGVLFSDDYDAAYFSYDNVLQFPVQVSSIVAGKEISTGSGGTSGEYTQILNTIDTTTKSTNTTVQSIDSTVQDTNTKVTNLQSTNAEILTKVLEVWQLMGLDLSNPKTITDTSITVNGITLSIGQPDENTTTVTRS